MAYIEIRNLSFSYKVTDAEGRESLQGALSDVSLDIERGDYVTLCGKSSSGKTTLLKTLKPVLLEAGLKEGHVRVEGIPIEEMSEREQAFRVGYVMQNPEQQIVTDRVWHELAFGLENIGTDPKEMRARIAEMASYFGIQNWFYEDIGKLSGGQKQLLNLAAVMAMKPEILLLDEPVSRLDPVSASEFINTVRKINRELATTVIITEHRLEEIYPLSDKAAVLDGGRLICFAPPGEAAALLYKKNDAMFGALPTPVRIYYGTEKTAEAGNCPLDVREGRRWLGSVLSKKPFSGESAESGAPDGTEREPKVRAARGTEPKKKKGDERGNSGDGVNHPALKVKDLWFRYEKNSDDILKGTDLTVERGSVYALVGGNGTGKTTLLSCICGTLRPYRGKVILFGQNTAKIKKGDLFSGNIAMLPQEPASIFAAPTLREDLEEMLGVKERNALERQEERLGMENVPLDERIERAAQLCGIEDLLGRHPYDLSGGEMERAALAKVLLARPRLLILDEPTKGIDSLFKEELGRLFGKLKKEGITVLMVSHDIEFCAKYADRAGMLFAGSVVSEDEAERFFAGNSFYTTAACRMAGGFFPEAVTAEQVISCIAKKREE